MRWPRVLAALLLTATIGQVVSIASSKHDHPLWLELIIAVLQLTPTIGLWAGLAYRYLPVFRIQVVRLVAFFTKSRTSMRVAVRFAVIDGLTADDIVEAIRARYSMGNGRGRVKPYSDRGTTILEMVEAPVDWLCRFEFSGAAPEEAILEEMQAEPVRHLIVTRPYSQDAIPSARALLNTAILPTIEMLTQTLPLRLESMEVTLKFLKGPNPYLAAYLQNVDLAKITTLKVVVVHDGPGAEAEISQNRVALRATSVSDLRNLVQEHLALQWTAR